MLLLSYEFALFLFIVFILYYIIPKRYQWLLLLLDSYAFYFFSGPKNLCYILFTTISTYLIVRQIEKRKQLLWLLLCLVLNIGMLAMVKVEMRLSFWNLAIPMGISFYVFQTMGYAIDVYRGKYEAEKNPFKLALFVSFFPQLIQGPISRFDELGNSLFQIHKFDGKTVLFGLQRILWGAFKKLVIAERLAVAVGVITENPEKYNGMYVLVGMLFYAVQLYGDFTGGIDITIGIAQMFGIKVTENFVRPYFSKSIREYWNRWHITMGRWFTDYVFYPAAVCGPMLKISRWARKYLGEKIGKRVPVYLSGILVWLATGIWHGIAWHFVVWGLLNCVIILISRELEPFYRWFHKKFSVKGNFFWKCFQVIRTILLMSCLRSFDCYQDVSLTFGMLGSMFTTGNWNILFNGALMELGLNGADYIVIFTGIILLLCVSLVQRTGSVREKIAAKSYGVQFVLWFGLFLLVLLWGVYGIGYDATNFIYHQF